MKTLVAQPVFAKASTNDRGEEKQETIKISASSLTAINWVTKYTDPERFSDMREIRMLFNEIMSHEVSDIFIMPGIPVAAIVNGKLMAVTHRTIDTGECVNMVKLITGIESAISMIKDGEPLSGLSKINELNSDGERDTFGRLLQKRFRYELAGCDTVIEPNGFQLTLRPLPVTPPHYESLNIPEDFIKSCIIDSGFVIIAGSTGSGKTTTLAATIRYILENNTIIQGNIVTHEEPIEFSYHNIRSTHSIVSQSAIGLGGHIRSFDIANQAALRRFPALVLVGELRNGATVQAAIELSQTGHPVFATTHATNIKAIIPRLLSRFPAEIQGEKAFDIIDSARVLVAQKLIRDVNGKRFAVREVLVLKEGLRKYLLRFAKQPDILARKIDAIMDEGITGSINFKRQADKLLSDDIIDELSYRRLVEDDSELDNETFEKLESV